jgi:hypothetical protein
MSPFARRAGWRVLLLASPILGCGGAPQADPARSNIQQLAVLCGRYATQNKGAPPKTLDQLKKFAKAQGAASEVSGGDLFISPRDQEPYVLIPQAQMGVPGVGEKKMLLHEKTGSGGKRYVVYSTIEIEEVGDARFQELLDGK